MGWYYGFKPYVSVAQRRAKAAKEMAKLAKKGKTITPVALNSSKIATTFWGKAWCDNLESYSDFSNRLPRGRTYVRNGSVVHLEIAEGIVKAVVSGSELYDVKIKIKPLASQIWKCLRGECAGQIGSLVELLQGKLSKGVMELMTRRDSGLFPKPAEIEMDCSCPDYAGMCKHIAAVMYGIGSRLDLLPDLLFTLRNVDHLELIASAGAAGLVAPSTTMQTLGAEELADVFGIEMAPQPAEIAVAAPDKAIRPTTRRNRASAPPGKNTPRDAEKNKSVVATRKSRAKSRAASADAAPKYKMAPKVGKRPVKV